MTAIRKRTAVGLTALLLMGVSQARADQATKAIYKRTLHATAWVGASKGSGTAWVVDRAARLLVTNHHVVENDDNVRIVFPVFRNGKLLVERSGYAEEPGFRGKVIDTDVSRDLAVIQLLDAMPEGTIELTLAADSAEPSDLVHSIGNPGASSALWVYTSGTVRAVYHKEWVNLIPDRKTVLNRKTRVLETQSPVNHGDSGGPVVNDKGELVAVVSSGKEKDASGNTVHLISWCIDVQDVRAFVDQTRRLIHPTTAEEYAKRGERRNERGRYAEAIEDFTAALRLDRHSAAAYRGRGWAFTRKNDLDTAVADLSEAVRLNDDDPFTYEARGRAYDLKGDREKAAADYTKAIQLDPKFARAYNNRGYIYHQQKNYERALADYTKAIEADPTYAVALVNRGDLYNDLKDYDRAVTDCTAALNINPFLTYAWNVRGWSMQAKGNYDGAVENFSQALHFNPGVPAFFVYRGNALTFKNEWNQALAHYSKAIELNKDCAEAYFFRASAYETLGNDTLSQPDYQAALRLNPTYGQKVTTHYRRYLKIVNERPEKIRVWIQYETLTKSGNWDWYPDNPGGKSTYWDIEPGKSTYLLDGDFKVRARRVRLWAQEFNTEKQSLTYRDADLWICPQQGYLAKDDTTFTYTFNK